VTENPRAWRGEDGEVLAEAVDGDFAYVLVRDPTGKLWATITRLVDGQRSFYGAGTGEGMLWVNDRSGRDSGVVGVAGPSASETVTIVFQGAETRVPVVNGWFAWMRGGVPSHTYPDAVRH
jgi:hypothetical protein